MDVNCDRTADNSNGRQGGDTRGVLSIAGRGRAFEPALLVIAGLAALLTASVRLAALNRWPGSPDSIENLVIARNMAEGSGLRTQIVCDHFMRRPVLHYPLHRRPLVPAVASIPFRFLGVSPGVPVLLNAVIVALSAFLMFLMLRLAGAGWFSGVGPLLYLVSANYEMVSLWDNNIIVLWTVILLLAGLRRLTGRMSPRGWIAAAGVLGGVGFVLKPTLILPWLLVAAVPMFLPAPGRTRRVSAVKEVLPVLLVGLLVSAPYWLGNWVRFGTPLYSVQPMLRLSERYGGLPFGSFETVRYGKAVTYGEMARLHGGWGGLLLREFDVIRTGINAAKGLNPYLWLLAVLGGGLQVARWWRGWRGAQQSRGILRLMPENDGSPSVATLYVLAAVASSEALLVPTLYFSPEDRYYWPAVPSLLLACAGALRLIQGEGCAAGSRCCGRLWAAAAGVLLVLAAVHGERYASWRWRRSFAEAVQSAPSWAESVRRLPHDALVMTSDPWLLTWMTSRASIITPGGARDDMNTVRAQYRPTHLLAIAAPLGRLNVNREDVRLLSSGEERRGRWRLYEFNPAGAPLPGGVERP